MDLKISELLGIAAELRLLPSAQKTLTEMIEGFELEATL
jgi:hypothetical protein